MSDEQRTAAGAAISSFLREQFGIDAAVTVAVREDKEFPRWRIDVVYDHYTGPGKRGYFSNEELFDTFDRSFVEQVARSILTDITTRQTEIDRLKALLKKAQGVMEFAAQPDGQSALAKMADEIALALRPAATQEHTP